MENIKETTSSVIVENTEHVNLQLQVVNESQEETNFGIEGSNLSLTINNYDEEVKNETSLVVLKSYNNLHCILNREKFSDAPLKLVTKQLNSKVIGADLYKNSKEVRNLPQKCQARF